MSKGKKILYAVSFIAVIAIMATAAITTTADSVQETAWALLPPVIAIVLALITKEVYSSLFLGILAGGLLYSGFDFEGTVNHVFVDGIISVLSDSANVGILVFLVILGAMVSLMNKAGGSAAFGTWASKRIKSNSGAQIATIILGILIFIDDYFNCLTVGSVMRPVTDRNKVSRAKLAYLIDATAAPVCIIAPISSWAAAVSGFVEGKNGIAVFVQTIPFNFYALLTICMMFGLVALKADYGPMKRHEDNAKNGDLYTTPDRPYANAVAEKVSSKGTVFDLLVPVLALVICCVIGMIYTGGFFSGTDFVDAFANCNASVGLVFGSFFGLVITMCLYIVRKVLTFKDCMECIPSGFSAMVPAILILTFAWSLKGMTDSLGEAVYVADVVRKSASGLMYFLPSIIFLIGCFLSFATGTSWGTFGILIPIVIKVFTDPATGAYTDYTMMIISMSACMAGAVCGDHCSPISDTTIMSSAGAQCNHMNHVTTQLPYAATCAGISFVTYILAGFIGPRLGYAKSAAVSLIFGVALLLTVLAVIGKTSSKDRGVKTGK